MSQVTGKPKFCVDCEHHRISNEGVDDKHHKCYKHSYDRYDLVTGLNDREYIFLCEDMREDYLQANNGNNPCGVEAKFFIKKGSR